MIDFNHLLNNLDLYSEGYKNKGLKINLEAFLLLENKLKTLQLKTEKMRAVCNKLCKDVATLKNEGKDTSEILGKITLLDDTIKTNSKKLKKLNLKINKKLKKLHNIPEFSNPYHEQVVTNFKNSSTLNDLKSFINENFKVESFNKTILYYFKEKRNFLFDESNMPEVISCKDGYLFLCSQSHFDEIKNTFLDYFSKNSLSLIKVSCRKLNKANEASYYVHLNKKQSLYFEINKEFYTREFNLKYRDKKIDMTKFVGQINVLLKW